MRHVILQGHAVVLTEEVGTVSGRLDVGVSEDGKPLVRYHMTDEWYHIVNDDDVRFDTPEDIVTLFESSDPRLSPSGNAIPFRIGGEAI